MAQPTKSPGIPIVKPVGREDAPSVFALITLAFSADAAARWMYPDPQQYLENFPRFAKALGGAAIARGTAFLTEDHFGAALWLPPDTAPDEEALIALLEASVADRERTDAFAVFEEMGRYHPDQPHWHLPLIGVEPLRQGQGHGSALMEYGLKQCDEAGLPAYLEASGPRSIPLYERHGFEVLGEIRIGRCPPIIPMLRSART